ncbi:MAG: hypothetical protein HRT47_11125 [Candidatus Caenarcaniphilales bacterium]|nr:hypothetical protein [Candidatus Caenarcaniphilales bacterium]
MVSINGHGVAHTNLNKEELSEPEDNKKKIAKYTMKAGKKLAKYIETVSSPTESDHHVTKTPENIFGDPATGMLINGGALSVLLLKGLENYLCPQHTNRETDIPKEIKPTT